MKRSFTTTLVGAAALVALAATGCKKDEKKEQAAASSAGGGGATGGAAADQGPLPAKTGFAVFPSTSKVIGGMNLASARSSGLWAAYKDQIEAAMSSKEMTEFKAA